MKGNRSKDWSRNIFLIFSLIFLIGYLIFEFRELKERETRLKKLEITIEERDKPLLKQKSAEYIMIATKGKFGYIDEKGKIVIEPIWDNISNFDKYGYARTIKNNKMGVIKKSGESVLENIYDNISILSADEFIVTNNSKKNLIKNGKKVFEEDCERLDYISDQLYILGKEKYKDIVCELIHIDKDNNVKILSEEYKNIIKIANNTFICQLNSVSKIVVVDNENNLEVKGIDIQNRYNKIVYIDSDIIIIKKREAVGIVDYDGLEIVPFKKYKKIENFYNGYSVVQTFDDKYGLINRKGEEIISPKYEYLKSSNKDNRLIFEKNGRYGFMDFNENIVIEPLYKEITDFYGNIAMYTAKDKVGLINENGKLIEEFLIVSEIKDNMIIAGNEDGFIVMNSENKKIVKIPWSDAMFWGSRYIKLKEKGTVKIIDYNGNCLFLGRGKDIAGEYYNQINIGNEIYLFDK